MHLYFDTVWKLHIGEIPEKPCACHPMCKYPFQDSGDCRQRSGISEEKYNEAIAAIKQNALTIGNPELIPVFPKPHINGFIIPKNFKPGEFYKWMGGYETEEIQEPLVSEYDINSGRVPMGTTISKVRTVAILTLPKEKKNTMENMTKEQAQELFNYIEAVTLKTIHQYSPHTQDLLRLLKRLGASGSVAAPKEELDYKDKLIASENSQIKSLQSELASLRQQLKEREEALKELLPIAEKGLNVAIQILGYLPNDTDRQYEVEEIKAIIERARKLISK